MCAVSVVGDNFGDRYWRDRFPQTFPQQTPFPQIPEVSKSEFEALKKEVAALKELLKAAKKFDKDSGQPDCEAGDKVAILKKVAELVGVNLKDIFPDAQ